MKWRVDAFELLTLAFSRDTFSSSMTNSRRFIIDRKEGILKIRKRRLVHRYRSQEGIELESYARLCTVGSFDSRGARRLKTVMKAFLWSRSTEPKSSDGNGGFATISV